MKQFSSFTFNGMPIGLFGSLDKPFVLCIDVLVRCLEHRMIQDSHFFRDNRTNTDLYLFDRNIWYFTQSGLTETLKRSHKKNARPTLKAFDTKIDELHKEQQLKQSTAPFQALIGELSASDALIGQLETHKDLLSVQHFLFQGHDFKVYGSNEEPLFLVNDIVCGLLGAKNIGDNQFFRDNREYQTFVTTWEFPMCPLDLQQRYKNNRPDHIHFFTERGLYNCLMRSNKPVAQLFQDEICALLKNIRLGYVQLVVTNSQAISQQIRQCIKSAQGLAEHHSVLMVKLGKYADIAQKSKRTISLYELKTEDGKSYRGQTNDPKRRFNQHRRSSCSPVIKEAYRRGLSVSEQVIRQVEVFNQDDIKFEEVKFIAEADPGTLLNRQTPKPDLSRVTVNCYHEESKSQEYELDMISEAITVQEDIQQQQYMKKPNDRLIRSECLWQQKYDDLIAYVKKIGKQPSKHSKDKEEAKIGMWIADQRKAQSGKSVPITTNHIQMLEKIVGWKWSKPVQVLPPRPFGEMVSDLSDYVHDQGKLPAPENVNVRARSLSLWIIEMRACNAKNGLSAQEKEQLQNVPGWEWQSRDSWYIYFKELQQFVERTNKLPMSDSGEKCQIVLSKWISSQKSDYRDSRLNTERMVLLETVANWSWESTEDRWLEQYNQAKEHIQTYNKVPTAGSLGKWTGHQREQYAINTLSSERVELLKQLGNAWYWNVKEKLFGQ